jgi:signal transduction histidine kinase
MTDADGGDMEMLDIDRGVDVDAGRQELLHVEVAFGVATAGDVGVRQFIHQHQLGVARQDGVRVHPREGLAVVVDGALGDDCQSFEQLLGLGSAVGLDHAPDDVLVVVEDSGVGIEPQHLDRIINAFFTTKPEGLGMRLPISRSVIEAHGGRLWATPNVGPGMTFQFTLPTSVKGAS